MAKNMLEQKIQRAFSLKLFIPYCLNSVLHGVFDLNASTPGFICIGVIQGVKAPRKKMIIIYRLWIMICTYYFNQKQCYCQSTINNMGLFITDFGRNKLLIEQNNKS